MKEKTKNRIEKTSFVLVCALVGIVVGAYIGYAASLSPTIYISGGVYPEGLKYTVYEVSGIFYAKDRNGYNEFNGTNHVTVINSAIEAANIQGGGTVLLMANAYPNSTAAISMKSNVALVGEGRGTKLTTTSTTINLIEIIGESPHPNDHQGIVISNLWLVGPNSGTGAGIYAKDAHNCIIEKNWIDYFGYGIMLNGSATNDVDNNDIIGNTIRYSVQDAIYLKANGVGNAIEENTITANNIETQGQIGINVEGNHNTFTGNVIEESHYHGIYLLGSENTITGNTIRESTMHGILIDGNSEVAPDAAGSGNTIIGNIILDNDYGNTNTYDGISLIDDADNNVISRNIIRNNDRYQVYSGSNCDANVISSNILYSTAYQGGIIYTATANNLIHDNLGFVTENSGTSTINASTTVTFNHGLADTPTHVEIGWQDLGFGDWKWNASATQITVTVTSSGTYDFSWKAEYKP